MKYRKYMTCLAIVLSFLFIASASYAAGNLKSSGSAFVIKLDKIKTASRIKAKDVEKFTKEFLTRDKRYTFAEKPDAKPTHVLNIKIAKSGKNHKFTMSGLIIAGGAEASFEKEISGRLSNIKVETEIARAIRTLFDYRPEKQKVMFKISGKSEEGEADGAMVEDEIYRAIDSEYDQVVADYYTMPVKDKDVPFLFKGDKKRFKTICEKSGVDVLITGTVTMPKTKNVGGASENRYKGSAIVRLRVWDLKKHIVITEVKLDLTGEGVFSELVFSLFDAAAKKSAEEIKNDLGFPEKVEEPKIEDDMDGELVPNFGK